jgi:YVTN family beta-propeller protein
MVDPQPLTEERRQPNGALRFQRRVAYTPFLAPLDVTEIIITLRRSVGGQRLTSRFLPLLRLSVCLCAILCVVSRLEAGTAPFATFESGHVRPLALSPDGQRLFAVNTPDNRVEILAVGPHGLTHERAVTVGLEPVAVAARSDNEVWVVNHLSDSVSVVDVGSSPPRVTRTLLVGDEPRDIVFAGPGRSRAFITTAHRGQNSPVDPQLLTPSIGRADVWVFDVDALGSSLGGDPLAIITVFGDTPRALAASADGNTVYAAIFQSGNQTTIVPEALVCNGGQDAPSCEFRFGSDSQFSLALPGGLPAPNTNFEGVLQPETGLIVRWNPSSGAFEDELGRRWPVPILLPDKDVFVIDAAATPPIGTGFFTGVGTILFNMVVNPVTGSVYVSNTEARNERRFEGAGRFAGSSVRGHLHEARITVLRNGRAEPRHLNKHIPYEVVPSPDGVKSRSLATPLGMALSTDGTILYVAAFGSDKVGVFDTAALEDDAFEPNADDHIGVSGGGPSGLLLDEERGRLYVSTRFDNGVSVIDLNERRELQHLRLYNPEPASVVNGRRFLYDARLTSSNGEASCASCHVFGDFDALAWDLGNPDAAVLPNPNPVKPSADPAPFRDFYPLKGPMTTQTLRGLAHHGALHWRGDRTGGFEPAGDPFDTNAAFKQFNQGFSSLLGLDHALSDEEMQAFADFVLQIVPPPNPIRALDNSLTPEQAEGRESFLPPKGDCSGCHVLDPARGFFGTDGSQGTNSLVPQFMKVPHLRNIYEKVGHFLFAGHPDAGFAGEQVRGFGFFHDGQGFQEQRIENQLFLFVFDSNLAPIVGQQITLTAASAAAVGARVDLLVARAAAGECDPVVKGISAGEPRGWYRTPAGMFQSDRAAEPPLLDHELRALAISADTALTYTCAPPGSGMRIGVDRDGDGAFDADEVDAGTDPGDPASSPRSPTPTPSLPPAATPTVQVPSCIGDCNGDGMVTIDELLNGVRIALGEVQVDSCAELDVNDDAGVTIDELLAAVEAALTDCPGTSQG